MHLNSFFKKSIGQQSIRKIQKYTTAATFEIKPPDLHNLNIGPNKTAEVTKNEAVQYYTQMQTIRRLESAAGSLYKEKLVRGFCHLYSGQEAIAVGVKSVLRPQDTVIAGYRIHGWVHLMGAPIFDILSELTGKRTGSGKGKGGSMHMYYNNFFGGNGIVGAQVPIGAGLAFASKYREDAGVNVSIYGDGAANQGQIFETFNMAKTWDLPCVFICENNLYGMGTSAERSSASTLFYTRGDFVPGMRVDGMDVLAVRECTKYAVDHAVSGKGPIILEMMTYRYSGHSMSDPGTSYRTREEVQDKRVSQDPINSFTNRIVSRGLVEEEELKKIDANLKNDIDEAIKKAKAEKEVENEELTADVYANPQEKIIRNVLPNEGLKHIQSGRARNS